MDPPLSVQETSTNQDKRNSSVQPWGYCTHFPHKRGEILVQEYISTVLPSEEVRLQLVKDVFVDLDCCHRRDIIYGDVNHKNVVVDGHGRAKLIPIKQCKRVENGNEEILDEIKKAGRLAYYIISGGQPYPEGQERWVSRDIILDFIERITHYVPSNGSRILDVLSHPIFWTDTRKQRYLQDVGNLPEVKKMKDKMKKITTGKSFQNWRRKMELQFDEIVQKMEQHRTYPNNTPGLLRFIRNLYQHRIEDAVDVNFTSLFPDLFETIYLFAEEKKWNSRIPLQIIFKE